MGFYTEEGCFNWSLKRTCLVTGIVFLVVGVLNALLGFLWGFTTVVPDVVYVACCGCLIASTFWETEYLCLPWFVGYLCLVISYVIMLATDVFGWPPTKEEEDDIPVDRVNYPVVAFRIIFQTSRLVIETLLLGYVYSYARELSGDVPNNETDSD